MLPKLMTQIEVGHGHLHMEGNIRNGEESPTMTSPLFVLNAFVLVVSRVVLRGGGQFYQDLALLLHQALPQCHPLHLDPSHPHCFRLRAHPRLHSCYWGWDLCQPHPPGSLTVGLYWVGSAKGR